MTHNPNQKNNLLDVFLEAENLRAQGIMPGLEKKHKQIMHKRFVPNKDVKNIENMFHRIGRNDESETMKQLNLSSAQVYAYNHTLKDMMEDIIIEMIRQGVIVLEVTDSEYNIPSSELTLIVCAANPKPSVKRIDIQRKED